MKRVSRGWYVFLGILAAVTFWYTGRAVVAMIPYVQRTTFTRPEHLSWSVFREAEGRYTPQGHYTYIVNGKRYRGSSTLSYPSFPNPYGIEQYFDQLQKRESVVWHAPRHPENASLERKFPYKKSLSAVALWVLLIYFFVLGYYYQKAR